MILARTETEKRAGQGRGKEREGSEGRGGGGGDKDVRGDRAYQSSSNCFVLPLADDLGLVVVNQSRLVAEISVHCALGNWIYPSIS